MKQILITIHKALKAKNLFSELNDSLIEEVLCEHIPLGQKKKLLIQVADYDIRSSPQNIINYRDLQSYEINCQLDNFGKIGYQYYYLVRGIDNREVSNDHVRKSIGKESTFRIDIDDLRLLFHHLERIITKLAEKIKKEEIEIKTITIKLRYDNFDTLTRGKTLSAYTSNYQELLKECRRILIDTYDTNRKVRLLGVSFTTLKHLNVQAWEQLIIDWERNNERFKFPK
jgi:nucleotidyltransferase/DNA polymerase involved in DNA repair